MRSRTSKLSKGRRFDFFSGYSDFFRVFPSQRRTITCLFTCLFQAPSSYSSSKDSNSSSEQVLGEIVAEFNDVMFFMAACYKSQVDLSYLCLHSQKVSFQHAPMVPQGAHVSMESAFSGAELQSTFYHTEPGMRHADGKSGEPMFSFAIKASSDTTKNIKVML